MRYAVWSTHVEFAGAKTHLHERKDTATPAVDVLEVTRTDRSVANNDRAIIQEIFHRKSWIQETES
jgi:hypothetical protein